MNAFVASIYGNGNRGGSPPIVYDTDAQAFFDKIVSLNQPPLFDYEKTAINNLVIAKKTAGTWNDTLAIYPCVGGTPVTMSLNLKNPDNFRIDWTGGNIYFNKDRIQFLGLGYGEMNIIPATHILQNTSGFGVWVENNRDAIEVEFGSSNAGNADFFGVATRLAGETYWSVNNTLRNTNTGSTSEGFTSASRANSSTERIYKNGSLVASATATSTAPNSHELIFGAYSLNGVVTNKTQKHVSYLEILNRDLNDSEQAANYNIISDFRDAKMTVIPEIGEVENQNFTTLANLANYTQVGSTMSLSAGVGILVSGGAGAFADYLTYDVRKTMLEKSLSALRFKQTSNTTGDSIGFGYHHFMYNADAVNIKIVTHVTGSNNIHVSIYSGNTQVASSSHIAFSITDTLRIELERTSAIAYTARIYNETTPANASCTYTVSLSGNGQQLSKLAIYARQGTQTVLDLKYQNKHKNNQYVCYVGNSITQWYNVTSLGNRFADKCHEFSGLTYSVQACQGGVTQDILNNIDELLELNAYVYVLNGLARNDRGLGISSTTWKANYKSIVNALKAAGKRVVHCYITPQNAFSENPTDINSFNYFIANDSDFATDVKINTYAGLKDPGGDGINPIYSGDGVHPNDAGHAQTADTIRIVLDFIQ